MTAIALDLRPDSTSVPGQGTECLRQGRVPGLEDIQSQPDDRDIAIEQVGVTDLRYPITVLDRAAESQHTVAHLTLSVGLPDHTKGTHMSRFIAVPARPEKGRNLIRLGKTRPSLRDTE